MPRRPFTFASAGTLLASAAFVLLASAATVAWVRSYWVSDSAWWNAPNQVHAVAVSRGKLELYFQQVGPTAPFRVPANRGHHVQPPSNIHLADSGLATAWERFGFGYTAGADVYGFRRIVMVPCWSMASVAGGLSTLCLLWRKRMRISNRRGQNHCVSCGYDLRATPDRCPECGTVPQKMSGG